MHFFIKTYIKNCEVLRLQLIVYPKLLKRILSNETLKRDDTKSLWPFVVWATDVLRNELQQVTKARACVNL